MLIGNRLKELCESKSDSQGEQARKKQVNT